MSETVNIVLAANDAYAPYCAAAIHSALQSAAEPARFRVHVVTGGLSDHSVALIERVASTFGSAAEIATIDDREVRTLPTLPHFTIDTYSRILAADALPSVPRFVYLDCDVAVCDDLSPLFFSPMADQPLAAVVHRNTPFHEEFAKRFNLSPVPQYVNAGVMLVDAERWRAEQVASHLVRWMHENQSRMVFSDQCAINRHFLGRIGSLHPRWNLEVRHYRDRWRGVALCAELHQAMRSPAVLHYSGPIKPWCFDAFVPQRNVFLRSLNAVLLMAGADALQPRRRLANWVAETAATARFRAGALRQAFQRPALRNVAT